jgi:hypothetical protein
MQTSSGPGIQSGAYRMRMSATHGNAAFDSEQTDPLLSSVTINFSCNASRNVITFTRTHRNKPSTSQTNLTPYMLVNI